MLFGALDAAVYLSALLLILHGSDHRMSRLHLTPDGEMYAPRAWNVQLCTAKHGTIMWACPVVPSLCNLA